MPATKINPIQNWSPTNATNEFEESLNIISFLVERVFSPQIGATFLNFSNNKDPVCKSTSTMTGRRSTIASGPLSDATNFQNPRLSMAPTKQQQPMARSRKSMAPGVGMSGLSDSLAHVSLGGPSGNSSSMTGNKRMSDGRKSLAPGAMAGNRQSTTG